MKTLRIGGNNFYFGWNIVVVLVFGARLWRFWSLAWVVVCFWLYCGMLDFCG